MPISGSLKRVNGYGSGNEIEGWNKIEAKNDAKIKRQLRGFENGILDLGFMGDSLGGRNPNTADSLSLTATNNQNITLNPGIATAYGYDLVVANLQLMDTVSPPATGNKYLFVFLEWDLSDPDSNEFNVGIWDNGTGTTWTPAEQDNLALVSNGKYRMPIYRLIMNSSGNITNILNYLTLGVPFKTGVEVSQYSNKAKDYDTTKGTIKEQFDSIDEEFVNYNARLVALGFRQGNITINGITQNNAIKRQGNYCILNFSGNYSNYFYPGNFGDGDLLGTLPDDFIPKSKVNFFGYVYGGGSNAAALYCELNTDGTIKVVGDYLTSMDPFESYSNLSFTIENIGYEAIALEVE